MKKLFLILICILFLFLPSYAWWGKKSKPVLYLSSFDPRIVKYDEKIENATVFKTNERIYFMIYVPKGFKSPYIKYQIVRQEDEAHTGGYKRIRNITRRVDEKDTYVDYFTISRPGKYYIQVFDITNLQQWLAIGAFMVKDE